MQNPTGGDDCFWHARYLHIHGNRVNLGSGLGLHRGGVTLLPMQETVINNDYAFCYPQAPYVAGSEAAPSNRADAPSE
jgi:hypothetical protein